MSESETHPLESLHTRVISFFQQIGTEFKLFWRSGQTIYLAFLEPKLVRERSTGIYKRLGGTPLPPWLLSLAT